MNRFFQLTIALVVFAAFNVAAQQPENILLRTDLDPNMAPFYHGVASGDPMPDRVIIWTRYTPDQSPAPVTINWEVATDTSFASPVQTGTFNTDDSRDYTVKVDVTGLSPNTWYFYRFTYNNRKSLTGRTRTAPVGSVDSLRFAVVSCSDYVDGYYHGYRNIAERNDLDAVIHLGDYIYENGSAGDLGRPHDPPVRITELADYRQRYSQYRLDHDLRDVHQMYPFINIWDDHEVANNAWMGGAEAHDDNTDGLYEERKRMAVQAFFEWIPIRRPDPNDTIRIYRKLAWGDLLDLYMIDTRIIARDEQVSASDFGDTSRYMLGREQLSWLSAQMQSSTAQWQILGQQVMMATFGPVASFNGDAWDGYAAERDRFYDTILNKNIDNLVVLTGDIHTAWANNLEDGNTAVGVEFVCPSITTMNLVAISQAIIQGVLPHVQFVDLDNHGYYVLDINQTRTQADFHFMDDISDPNGYGQTPGPFWYTNDGTRVLAENQSVSVPRSTGFAIQPSRDAPNQSITTVEEAVSLSVIGTYPNPFWADFAVKTYLFEQEDIVIRLFDSKGALVKTMNKQTYAPGLHYIKVEASNLPKGNYQLQLQAGNRQYVRTMIKM